MSEEKFDDREKHLGTNYKEKPTRTPFYKLFLYALDDFMLKLLMVAAVISYIIDMGFVDDRSELAHGKIFFVFPIYLFY